MRRLSRWFRSLSALVVLNAILVLVGVAIGCLAFAGERHRPSTGPGTSTGHATERTLLEHAGHILRVNLSVAGGMLAGVCTLGGLSALTLLWNAFGLGYGLLTLGHVEPAVIPLVFRYVLIEFFALVLVVSVAEHLGGMVLRCLAANEPVRLKTPLVALGAAVALLTVAALIEADVTGRVARGLA